MMHLSASDSTARWTANEPYYPCGGIILFFISVIVMPLVFVQVRRSNSTGNCMNCCSIIKHRLKHEDQHIETQAAHGRSKATLIGSASFALCYDGNELDSSLPPFLTSNSRTSNNSNVRIQANPLAESNENEPQSEVLLANSQHVFTNALQDFNSQNSISSENPEISQHWKQTDMDALSQVSVPDSNIPEDSDSGIVEALQRRQLSDNHYDPYVINFSCKESDVDLSGLCDQDIADLKGLSKEPIGKPTDEQCLIIPGRSNTDKVHSSHASSLPLSSQQHNAGLASASFRPNVFFIPDGCQQSQHDKSDQGSGAFSDDFRMEHREQVYNPSDSNIAEINCADKFESISTDPSDPDLHYNSSLLLEESVEQLIMDKTDRQNHQITTDLLQRTNNTDHESVLPTDDNRNDLGPDASKSVDNEPRQLPDLLLTTVDGRQDPTESTSLTSLAIGDIQQSSGGYYFTSSHSLVSQVTEDADNYNLPAAHFSTGRSSFTESELVRTSTQRPRLESESSTGTGSSTAMLASSAVSAGQLVRALVAHLTTRMSSTNHQFCEIQHILPRLLEATVSENQDSRFLENLLRGTSLTIDLLTAACYGGFQETVERLIFDNSLLINQQDSTGATPLAAASAAGNLPTVRWLLRNEADVNIPTGNSRTSLIVACEKLQHNVFWYLTGEANVDLDVDAVDDDSNTALHYVIEKSSNGGRSLLHDVCIDSDAGYVRKIVFASSRNEVNAQDNDGWTPLHLACLMGKLDVVNILMWAGADTDVLDNAGNTPGDLAVLLGYYNIAVTLGHRPYPENSWFPTDFPFFMNVPNE